MTISVQKYVNISAGGASYSPLDPSPYTPPGTESAARQAARLIAMTGGVDRMYIRPQNLSGNSVIGKIAHVYANGTGAAWELRLNPDGMLQTAGCRVGGIAPTDYGNGNPPENITGIGGSVATENSYATTVGGTLTGRFSGKGFAFQSYADDRGGVWQFEVDKGLPGARIFLYSTWANPIVSNKREIIVSDLVPGNHTVLATFMGDDPLHAPTGGVARGWFKNLTVNPFYDVDDSVPNNAPYVATNRSIVEFAISARPTDKAVAIDWVPAHNVSVGAQKNLVRKMYFNNVEVATIPTDRAMTSFRVEQTYDAYNSFDTVDPTRMWYGYCLQEWDARGYRERNYLVTTAPLTIGDAYLSMTAADASNVTKLRYSTGEIFDVAVGDKSTNLATAPNSAIYYNPATRVASLGAVTNIADALSLEGIAPGFPGVFHTERTDGVTKVYWDKKRGGTVPVGTVWQSEILCVVAGGVDV